MVRILGFSDFISWPPLEFCSFSLSIYGRWSGGSRPERTDGFPSGKEVSLGWPRFVLWVGTHSSERKNKSVEDPDSLLSSIKLSKRHFWCVLFWKLLGNDMLPSFVVACLVLYSFPTLGVKGMHCTGWPL